MLRGCLILLVLISLVTVTGCTLQASFETSEPATQTQATRNLRTLDAQYLSALTRTIAGLETTLTPSATTTAQPTATTVASPTVQRRSVPTAAPTWTDTPTLTPTASDTPPPADKLPDLLVSRVWTRMQNYEGGCVLEYQPAVLTVCVMNSGDADAGSFHITLLESEWFIDELAAGEETCADFQPVGGEIMVDTFDDVLESDEDNNSMVAQPMTLTPPPICTPTPTP